MWFAKKKVCEKCGINKTKRDFEGMPTCSECKSKIVLSREEKRNCLLDGTVMKKEFYNDIIIDRCPECNGIWLDSEELEAIKEAMDNGDSQFATGMLIGISMK